MTRAALGGRALSLAAGLGVVLSACDGAPPAARTWTPEDHAHPPGSVPVPVGAQVSAGVVDDGLTPEQRTARSVFLVACAGCHGAEGRGDGPERAPVMRLPSFADATWQGSRTDDELVSIISLGRGMMPAFGERIPSEGVRALVAHVRSLAPPPPPVVNLDGGVVDGGDQAGDAGVDGDAGAAALPVDGEGVVE